MLAWPSGEIWHLVSCPRISGRLALPPEPLPHSVVHKQVRRSTRLCPMIYGVPLDKDSAWASVTLSSFITIHCFVYIWTSAHRQQLGKGFKRDTYKKRCEDRCVTYKAYILYAYISICRGTASSPIQTVKMETSAEEVSGPLISSFKMVSGETLPSAG